MVDNSSHQSQRCGRKPGQLVLSRVDTRTPSGLVVSWIRNFQSPDRLRVFRRYFEESASTDRMADFLAEPIVMAVMATDSSTLLSKDMAELAMLGDYVVTLLHEQIELAKHVTDGRSIRRRST